MGAGHGMTLTRYDDYKGQVKAKVKGVVSGMYTGYSTAYPMACSPATSASSGTCRPMPAPAPGTSSKTASPNRPGPDVTGLGYSTIRVTPMSVSAKHIGPSTARQSSTRSSWAPGWPPTRSRRPPSSATRANACGKWCEYHRTGEEASPEANFDMSKPVEIWFNAGAGHDGWMTAVCQHVSQDRPRLQTAGQPAIQ